MSGTVFTDALTWKRGNTETDVWEFFEDEARTAPTNLTGYTATMWVKRSFDDAEAALVQLSSPSGGLVITALPGKIAYEVSSTQTAALAPGVYQFDVLAVPPSGKKEYLVEGKITVYGRVTE